MRKNNCVNNYVPEFVPQDLLWYERDGLMTYYNQVKCHLKTAKIINFDIIRREAAGEKVPDELLKKYQTVQNELVSTHPKNDQKNVWVVLFILTDLIFFLKRMLY